MTWRGYRRGNRSAFSERDARAPHECPGSASFDAARFLFRIFTRNRKSNCDAARTYNKTGKTGKYLDDQNCQFLRKPEQARRKRERERERERERGGKNRPSVRQLIARLDDSCTGLERAIDLYARRFATGRRIARGVIERINRRDS